MPKRIYSLGEPCDHCQKPTTQGKFGAYCVPCYVAYKEGQKQSSSYVPKTQENASNVNFNAIQLDLEELKVTISKIRVAFADLSKRVQGLETLVEHLSNKKALEFHQGVNPQVEVAAQILGGEVEIPTINHIPWDTQTK
jgi:hypothetical protein